jgi:hypothetical protein
VTVSATESDLESVMESVKVSDSVMVTALGSESGWAMESGWDLATE